MTRKKDDSFFVGWADTPAPDRRFFLRAGIGLTVGSAVLAGGLAALQTPPGTGSWNQGAIREWRGIVTGTPYAMLRTLDLGGGPRTALLSCLGKCGVAARLGSLAGKAVVITGSLIQRGRHSMIAVNEMGEWIREDDGPADPSLVFPDPEPLGSISLAGEILDSKCWFGAMRPSEGKVHKACASLCIRGGIPPAFFARDKGDRSALMIMVDNGRSYGDELLPFIADPVRLSGELVRADDLLILDAPITRFERV
ncbi:hypothetical protein [Hyphomonas sp.]|uniref:hypothetical protein n=1 Tax=Hyphomonas sp. TaxID=87 RepID=UPI00352774F1